MNAEKARDYWIEFHEKLNDLGIKNGDIIYIGSDIMAVIVSAMRDLEFSSRDDQTVFMNSLIDELKQHVSGEGTVLFPVYSWAWCRGKGFDYHKTQGEVGSLNNFVLNNRTDFVRTKHPIYSFMVWGKYADELYKMNNQEAWSTASPFYFLHKHGAKEIDLNVAAVNCFTFKHYVEMSVKVPYRYPKFFMGTYIDENGVAEERNYSMYVRDLDVKTKSSQSNEFFERNNAGKTVEFHGWKMHLIEWDKAFDLLKDDLLNNGGKNVYTFENYEIRWPNERNVYEVGFWKDKNLLHGENAK